MTVENHGEGATSSTFPWTDAQMASALRGVAISGGQDISTLRKVIDRLSTDVQTGNPELVQQLGKTLVQHVRDLNEVARMYDDLAERYGVENQFYMPPQETGAETAADHLE